MGKMKFHIGLTRTLCCFFPKATNTTLAEMMTFICKHELNKLRVRSPRPIPREERKQLLDLFNSLDDDGSGTCSAEELVTASMPGMKPILDIETVHLVCGKEELNCNQFFEFMCQDGFLAHPEATVCYRKGVELRRCDKEEVNWKGWVLAEPPSEIKVKTVLTEQLEKAISKLRDPSPTSELFARVLNPSTEGKCLAERWNPVRQAGRESLFLPDRTLDPAFFAKYGLTSFASGEKQETVEEGQLPKPRVSVVEPVPPLEV